MASKNGITIPEFIGSSYQMDVRAASDELSLNMYIEPLPNYSNGPVKSILRSIDGNESVLSFPEAAIGCRGLYTVSRGPDLEPDMYAVYGNTLYRINSNLSKVEIGQIGATNVKVNFAESGGVNSHLCILTGSREMRICSTQAFDTDVAGTFDTVPLPVNIYDPNNADLRDENDGIRINATHIVNMGNRLIVNDANNGQIFLSRPGAFQGGSYAIYDLDAQGHIQYEGDGYTPKYRYVDNNTYGWRDMYGAYMYETVMSTMGDRVLAIESINGQELWTFGNQSFDVWGFSDDTEGNYSITRTGFGCNIGIAAPQSLAKVNNRLCWLGRGSFGDNAIWVSGTNAQPLKISTPALERELAKLPKLDDAYAFAYNYGGHEFYVISFPASDKTYVYDFLTKAWHNRATRDRDTNIEHMWYPSFACNFSGKVYFGTYQANQLLIMNQNKHTEWDNRPIVRLRRSPVMIDEYSNIILDEFRIECNVGCTEVLQPLTNDHETEGYDPKVLMRCSYDGGNTYGYYITETLGRAGEYGHICNYYGLGMGRLYVIEVSCSDPVDFMIIGAKARIRTTRSF